MSEKEVDPLERLQLAFSRQDNNFEKGLEKETAELFAEDTRLMWPAIDDIDDREAIAAAAERLNKLSSSVRPQVPCSGNLFHPYMMWYSLEVDCSAQTGAIQLMEVDTLISPDRLTEFCRRWKISELALFGSALRPDFKPTSDLDFLVSFEAGAEWGLFDHVAMQLELADLLDREVDLISRRALENSGNRFRRNEILNSARVLYRDGAAVHGP